jgi:hypothetical protein
MQARASKSSDTDTVYAKTDRALVMGMNGGWWMDFHILAKQAQAKSISDTKKACLLAPDWHIIRGGLAIVHMSCP